VKNFSSATSILAGDELLSINGQSIRKIISVLFSLIPSDGYNLTMKYRALYLQFPNWYRDIDLSEDFNVVVKHDNAEKTYQLKGQNLMTSCKTDFYENR